MSWLPRWFLAIFACPGSSCDDRGKDKEEEDGPTAVQDDWTKKLEDHWRMRKFDFASIASPAKSTSSSKGTSLSKPKPTDEATGKKLASFLRRMLLRFRLHELPGISVDKHGWVVATEIPKNAAEYGLGGCTTDDLIRIVENDVCSTSTKRFETDGLGRLRAIYAHTPSNRGDVSRQHGNILGSSTKSSRSGGDDWCHNKGLQEDNSKLQSSSKCDDEGGDSWEQPIKLESSSCPDSETEAVAENHVHACTTMLSHEEDASKTDYRKACDWEQWFTPDNMEMYYFNAHTKEFFFPGDAGDLEAKLWCRFVDTEGDNEGKIYWWHQSTSRWFYEEDAISATEARA